MYPKPPPQPPMTSTRGSINNNYRRIIGGKKIPQFKRASGIKQNKSNNLNTNDRYNKRATPPKYGKPKYNKPKYNKPKPPPNKSRKYNNGRKRYHKRKIIHGPSRC